MLQNIPTPVVKDLDGFAYIPLEQIISHIVAFGTDGMLTFEHDSDWTNNEGQYSGTYFKDMHDEVKRMKQVGEIPHNTRIHHLRTWSDGFIAFHIKADSEHNNLQLFTLTIMASDGASYSKKKKLTLPFALGFKKKDHCVITNQLLQEMKEARVVKERYCGKEKRLVPMVFFLQLIMADYPERCANTYTSQLGIYTHRWGYSCKFDQKSTPSCPACESARIDRVMRRQESEAEPCTSCYDWFSEPNCKVIVDASDHPSEPGKIPTDVPVVKLNFRMLWNSCKTLVLQVKEKKITSKDQAKKYLQLCGVAKTLAETLIAEIFSNEDGEVDLSNMLPELWKLHELYKVDLEDFASLPMHMCALGIEKALIPLLKRIFNLRSVIHQYVYNGLVSTLRKNQKKLSTISVDWLMAMPFTGKESGKIGTSTWNSEHYVAFTRISLVQFSKMDTIVSAVSSNDDGQDKDFLDLCKAFKSVRVLWFCLMSRVFADEKVSSDIIDDYVKLFLSACTRLDELFQAVLKKKAEAAAKKKAVDAAKKKAKEAAQSASKKKKKNTKTSSQTPSRGSGTESSNSGSETEESNKPTKRKSNGKSYAKNKKKRKKQPNATSGKEEEAVTVTSKGSFVTSGCNFLSLLNMKDAIDRYGSMRELWEGLMEGYIQNVKRELSTLRHNDGFMKVILNKLLRTCYLENVNEGNPFSQRIQYSRTLNVTVYACTTSLHELLGSGDIISGVVANGALCVCVQGKGSGSPIYLHPINFSDEGLWYYNLWYSSTECCDTNAVSSVNSRKALTDLASDYFVLMPMIDDNEGSDDDDDDVDINNDDDVQVDISNGNEDCYYTVLCHSWRVRNSEGKLALPTPLEDIFY